MGGYLRLVRHDRPVIPAAIEDIDDVDGCLSLAIEDDGMMLKRDHANAGTEVWPSRAARRCVADSIAARDEPFGKLSSGLKTLACLKDVEKDCIDIVESVRSLLNRQTLHRRHPFCDA